MSDEFKGEMFAWITCFIWMFLLLDAAIVRGSIDLLLGGFIVWTVVTGSGLLVWAIAKLRGGE